MFNEYQEQAKQFRTETADHWYAIINLPGEVGELCSLIAKGIRDGFKEDYLTNVKKELGDVLWHIAAIADDHQLNLQDIADGNIAKLQSRKDRDVIKGSGDNR
jgi:NTP pyrophosphatase (non-canonical NTP hydrolase)